MPGLLLIVSEASGERFAAAVELAGAAAALGRPVAVLLRACGRLGTSRWHRRSIRCSNWGLTFRSARQRWRRMD